MKSDEKNNWWERNRKIVIVIGSITTAVIIGGVIIYVKRDLIGTCLNAVTQKISTHISGSKIISENYTEIISYVTNELPVDKKIINNGEPFNVSGHIRNMSQNRQAWTEKLELAKKLGLELKKHQTFVSSYTKNIA